MTMLLTLASDRRKEPERIRFRRMTSAEAHALSHSFEFRANDGKVRNARRSGKVKTWKTRPHDYRIPVKYGLYESSALVPDPEDVELAAFENSESAVPVVREENDASK